MRITKPFVQAQLDRLNKLAGMPLVPYQDNKDGKGIVPMAGCYHLDNAYGGYSLQQMSLRPGCTGTTVVNLHGYVSLKKISDEIFVFANGYRAAKEAMEKEAMAKNV